MSEKMVNIQTLDNQIISVNPAMLKTAAMNIVRLTTGNIVKGTTLAQSSITIAGSSIPVVRPATSGETRVGILMNSIPKDTTVSTPPVQADLSGAVVAEHGVFKAANVTDETVKGTIQAKTKENVNLMFEN